MYTPIELDKTRNVLLGFEALQLFKKLTGKSLLRMKFNDEDIEDYIPTVFYVGLVHEDKELTQEAVTKLIDTHLGLAGTIQKFYEIIDELMPDNVDSKN